MIPYGFTFTSHIIVTFAMAAVIFVGVTLLAIYKHGLRFFTFFLPPGVPMWMAPLLVPIEIISYFVRPVSLSLRLAPLGSASCRLSLFRESVPRVGSARILKDFALRRVPQGFAKVPRVCRLSRFREGSTRFLKDFALRRVPHDSAKFPRRFRKVPQSFFCFFDFCFDILI